ncbi:hypothetical protein [Roseibium salinum]|uniref:4Fe-4S ferredoxin-type domain-containing protein n=1 Tax=Roseibium salinum TaxID=1604349 RepID=A0ABT3R736_9HYPH|nr:hypothetical protein [Roseibium sp. DSM 29163]MCX2725106.1 hypothetical protein [Roseibium sp. DSM 29163]
MDDLAAAGFLYLGGFAVEGDSTVPRLSGGKAPGALFLIGSTGPSLWPHLTRSPEFRDGAPDPLDRYTKRILSASAIDYGFEALFPFEGPPYHPFQQWALRCGGFSRSPLGVLAHAEYGPWAGFRAAFLSAGRLIDAAPAPEKGPCESCADKPCLTVCPVEAISLEEGYRAGDCRSHLAEHRDHDCWTGCLARRACPFGRDHRQSAGTARFHMDRFVGP